MFDYVSGCVSPPRVGEILAKASSTATASLDLKANVTPGASGAEKILDYWRGRYLSIQADGAAVYVALSDDSADTLDPTNTAGTTAAPNTSACILVPDGGTLSLYIPGGENALYRYLLHRTASGTATLRVWASSPKER